MVQVSTLDYKAVVLGDIRRSGTTAWVRVTNDAPQFDKSPISPRGPDGAFTIQTMTDFFIPNPSKSSLPTQISLHQVNMIRPVVNIFVGLGGDSAEGGDTVIPLLTHVAHPPRGAGDQVLHWYRLIHGRRDH